MIVRVLVILAVLMDVKVVAKINVLPVVKVVNPLVREIVKALVIRNV